MKLCKRNTNLTIEELEVLIQYFDNVTTLRSLVIPNVSIINCRRKVDASFGSWTKMLEWLGYKEPPVKSRYKPCEVCNKQFKGMGKCCSDLCTQKLRVGKPSISLCKLCSSNLDSERSFCNSVCKLNYGMSELTLKNTITLGKDASKFGNIRCRARSLAFQHLPKRCEICSYSSHVEVCHIIPLKDTSENTPLSSVNNMNNLVVLCRNHHWELDNGLLSVKDINRLSCKYYEV